MKTFPMIALLAVVACGGKKTGGSSACTEAATKAIDAMVGGVASSPDLPEQVKTGMKERGERLKAVMIKHCTEDHWSADVIACYRDASSMPTIRACREKLPPDQAGKLLTDEMAAMRGGPMGGMGGMPGGMPQGQGMMGSGSAAGSAGSATGSGSAQ